MKWLHRATVQHSSVVPLSRWAPAEGGNGPRWVPEQLQLQRAGLKLHHWTKREQLYGVSGICFLHNVARGALYFALCVNWDCLSAIICASHANCYSYQEKKENKGFANWHLILTVYPTPLPWMISSLAQTTFEISAFLFSILIVLSERGFLATQHMAVQRLQQASYPKKSLRFYWKHLLSISK